MNPVSPRQQDGKGAGTCDACTNLTFQQPIQCMSNMSSSRPFPNRRSIIPWALHIWRGLRTANLRPAQSTWGVWRSGNWRAVDVYHTSGVVSAVATAAINEQTLVRCGRRHGGAAYPETIACSRGLPLTTSSSPAVVEAPLGKILLLADHEVVKQLQGVANSSWSLLAEERGRNGRGVWRYVV